MLAILWALPLFYAIWTAFHAAEFSTRFSLTAPLTLENFVNAWKAAPFARYFVNTIMCVSVHFVKARDGEGSTRGNSTASSTSSPSVPPNAESASRVSRSANASRAG